MRILITSACLLLFSMLSHAQIARSIDFFPTDGSVQSIEITGDGSAIYAIGCSLECIMTFERDSLTGSLSLIDTDPLPAEARQLYLSEDDRFIYVGGRDGLDLAMYARNPDNNQLELISEGILGLNPDPSLPEWEIYQIALGNQGNNIYAIVLPTMPITPGGQDFPPANILVYTRDSETGLATLIQTIANDESPLTFYPLGFLEIPGSQNFYLDFRNFRFLYKIGDNGRLTFNRQFDGRLSNGFLFPFAISNDSRRFYLLDPGPPVTPPAPILLGVYNHDPVSGDIQNIVSTVFNDALIFDSEDLSSNVLLADERLLALSDGNLFRVYQNIQQTPIQLNADEFIKNTAADRFSQNMAVSPDENYLYYAYENGIDIMQVDLGGLPPESVPVPGLQHYSLTVLILLLLIAGIYQHRAGKSFYA